MHRLILLFILLFTYNYSNEINVKAKKVGNKIIVYSYNNALHHATIKYNAKTKNLISLCTLPLTVSVLPKSQTKICEFYISNDNFSYNGNYKWVLGTQNATHNDNYVYRLPYEIGTKQLVTQSFNGSFSHFGNSKYAVDFGLKEGTKIYASREGLIVAIKSNSKDGGANKKYLAKANHITILHDDNTYAVYNHLLYNGVKVKVGQVIKKGEFLGYSGNTGYTNGAHLHFVVYKIIDTQNRQTIPIKFKTKRGIISSPIKGHYYTAVE